MVSYSHCGWELNSKEFCQNCYFDKIESEDIEESNDHVMTEERVKSKYPDQGSHVQFYCNECGVPIVYDLN